LGYTQETTKVDGVIGTKPHYLLKEPQKKQYCVLWQRKNKKK